MADAQPTFDWLTLDGDEAVVWAGKPHESSLVPALVVGIPLTLVLIGIPIIVAAYLTRENTEFVVTTEALYRKSGILSRNVQRVDFEKVQNTSYSQGVFGRQFGYGSVEVSTAGGAGVEMSFQSVPDPKRVQELVSARVTGDDAGPPEDGAAILDEILTELRAIRTAVEGGEGAVDRRDAGTRPGDAGGPADGAGGQAHDDGDHTGDAGGGADDGREP